MGNTCIFKQRIVGDHMTASVFGEFPAIDKIRATAVYVRQSQSGLMTLMERAVRPSLPSKTTRVGCAVMTEKSAPINGAGPAESDQYSENSGGRS